ncbi:MAG TPA: IS110 family transposase [Desulfatiglandales bacterium]|nr:IS110 family transposase [Desulfatiglandales bacterium]
MKEVDSIRIKEFRQLKKEVRGSKDYLIVGIDVAKDKHNAFFGTATGKTLFKRLVFENTREGFERLLIQTDTLKAQHALTKTVFGLEPTANYHKPLGEFLIKSGHMVVLVSGVAVKRNRELLDGRWDKHDTKDSANVADLISQGKCLFYEYPSMALRDLRNLLSLKKRLKKQEHGLRVRIRNHVLAQYFPEMDSYYGQSESNSLEIVKWCLNPSVIAGLEYEQFLQLVAPQKRGIWQQNRLKAIWKKAVDSIGCDAGESLEFEAKAMVEALEHIRETIRATDAKIKEICLQFPEYSYLLTIPGFGPDISSKVLGAIGNPFRFNSGKQVLKMAGMDLSANRSGKNSDSAIPVISKKGKADLRYALYQAALIASIRDRHFIVYYTNKLRGREKEKGIKTKMRVKLAAKMLIIAWTLMKKKEVFYTPQAY